MTEPIDLADDRRYTKHYKSQTPDILASFQAFDATVFAAEGRAIDLKHRELIAVAVAITTQCLSCIDSHSKRAVAAGATETELAEAAWVATAIRAGGGFAHGRLAFKYTDAGADHAH